MSCVDEAVCGRFGPPTFAQHLGQVIEQIDRVQKRVRDMQEEEEGLGLIPLVYNTSLCRSYIIIHIPRRSLARSRRRTLLT